MLLETIIEYYDGRPLCAASTNGGVTFRSWCNLTSDHYGLPLLQRAVYDGDDPQAPEVTCPECVVMLG